MSSRDGCISINVSRITSGGKVSFERKNGNPDVDTTCCNDIDVDVLSKNSRINTINLMYPLGKAEVSRVDSNMKVSFGIVCGTYLGYDVLYASDGALITINGKYLMVKKKRK